MTYDITHADAHRPTEAFADFLEGELGVAFRRERTRSGLRRAAVVLVSLVLGTSAGLASAQVSERSQRDSLLEAAQADAMIVQVRLNLARAQVVEARRAASAGAVGAESVANAELQAREMESQLGRAALNIDEIKATLNAPRDELNAPLVNKRDFVKERIQLRLMVAQQQMQAAEAAQMDVARRVRAGVVSEVASAESDVEVARARRELIVLAERLALRKEYLDKGTAIDALARRLESAELRQDVVVAQRAMDVARVRASLLEKRKAVGAAEELDVMRANLELKERELELQRLARRLKTAPAPRPD